MWHNNGAPGVYEFSLAVVLQQIRCIIMTVSLKWNSIMKLESHAGNPAYYANIYAWCFFMPFVPYIILAANTILPAP